MLADVLTTWSLCASHSRISEIISHAHADFRRLRCASADHFVLLISIKIFLTSVPLCPASTKKYLLDCRKKHHADLDVKFLVGLFNTSGNVQQMVMYVNSSSSNQFEFQSRVRRNVT